MRMMGRAVKSDATSHKKAREFFIEWDLQRRTTEGREPGKMDHLLR